MAGFLSQSVCDAQGLSGGHRGPHAPAPMAHAKNLPDFNLELIIIGMTGVSAGGPALGSE